MNRNMRVSMYIFFSVFLIILSACATKPVERVAVKKVLKEGYVILRNDTVFLSVIKRLKRK